MHLQQLHDIAHLFASHTLITHIARISDNVIHIRLDSINYCIDLDRGNPKIYSHTQPLKSKEYNAPFDIALSKYLYKARIVACRLDGMNKILKLSCVYKNAYKSMQTLLQIECINRMTNAIILQDERVIAALRFYDTPLRRVVLRERLLPLKQPPFTKELQTHSTEEILESLQKEYTTMQTQQREKKREKILNLLYAKKKKLCTFLESLPQISALEREKEEQYMLANHIITHLDSIPSYTTHITLESKNYAIPCAPKPSLASDKLFKMAKKTKQKIESIHLQKENLESKITFLCNQIAFAKSANNEELDMLLPKAARNKKQQKSHYESFYIDGIKISMGRNERENIKLLQESKGDFLWLHIQNIPSSHLIIHASRVEAHVLEYAGILLAKLSGIKDNKVVIDYTKRRFVKLMQGAHVVYAKEQKLHIFFKE